MIETREQEEVGAMRKFKTTRGIGLPAGTDYPNIDEIEENSEEEVFWRKEVANSFEVANNGYSFYRIQKNNVFAKDLSGYWYRLNNKTKCFEFLFDGFKDTTDYTRINIPPQPPTFVGFNYLHQAVFPMNDDGKPILPKDDKGKTIFPYYDGYPLFPVDDSGAVCVPLGDDGKPVFPRIPEEFGAYVPCDVTGRVVLPMDENAEPVYPRDEEGNVLMPFIILEDGSRKRAVYCADDGAPILPFHNGEHALIVHEGEVLFQYEYQQKMMILAQYPNQKRPQPGAQLMDEQFYLQHTMHYNHTLQTTVEEPSPHNKMEENAAYSAQNSGKNTPTTSNLLLQQLSFLKKKKTQEATPLATVTTVTTASPTIPAERPAKPNKEKKKADRYIPESNSRHRTVYRSSPHLTETQERKRRLHRSRSHTYSPPVDDRRGSYGYNRRSQRSSESRSFEKNVRKRETKSRKYEHEKDKKRSKKSRRDRSSSSSSRSSSSDTDYSGDRRREKRHTKTERYRR